MRDTNIEIHTHPDESVQVLVGGQELISGPSMEHVLMTAIQSSGAALRMVKDRSMRAEALLRLLIHDDGNACALGHEHRVAIHSVLGGA